MRRELFRLLGWVRPAGRRAALAVALQAATVAAGVSLMATSGWLISRAALRPSIAVLQVAVVGVRFLGITRGLLRYGERLVSHDVTLRLVARVRVAVFVALEPVAPARLVAGRGGDVLARLIGDVQTLEQFYARWLGPVLAAGVAGVFAVLLLLPRGGILAGALAVGLCAAGLVWSWAAWRLGAGPAAHAVCERADVSARLVDGVQGLADLVAFDRQETHAGQVETTSRRLASLQVRCAAAASLGAVLVGLTADLTAAAVLALAAASVRSGTLDGVQVAVVTLVALASFEAVAALPAAFQGLGATRAAASRLFELLDASPAVPVPPRPLPRPRGTSLHMRHLRFAYPGEAAPALDGVDLSVTRGRVVAVVGESGSGKSTLVHLLQRFWEVEPGMLRLDGHDVRAYRPDDVRACLAVASQRVDLFTGTIGENLRLARPEATDAEVANAARRASLHDVVAVLPDGYDTWIGEQGLRLSGGERQRLAFARALVSAAPILALDEPTANLDAITERAVLEEIYRQATERAVLLVTHRLAGLERADEIIVLDRGRVVERGAFEDLRRRGLVFARMLDAERSADVVERTRVILRETGTA